jgi:hypothetical protein
VLLIKTSAFCWNNNCVNINMHGKTTLKILGFCSCCFKAFGNLNAFFILNLRKFNQISIRIDKQHLFLILLIPCAVIVITFLRSTQRHDPSVSKTSILDVCVYVTILTVNNNISVNFNQECESYYVFEHCARAVSVCYVYIMYSFTLSFPWEQWFIAVTCRRVHVYG